MSVPENWVANATVELKTALAVANVVSLMHIGLRQDAAPATALVDSQQTHQVQAVRLKLSRQYCSESGNCIRSAAPYQSTVIAGVWRLLVLRITSVSSTISRTWVGLGKVSVRPAVGPSLT